MKSYIEKNYSKDFIKGDLEEKFTYYTANVENVDRQFLIDEYGYVDPENDPIVTLNGMDAGKINDWTFVSSDFDEEEYLDFINNTMKKYNNYFVLAYGCTWTGAIGYTIKNNLQGAFSTSGDCSQYITGSSKSGKYLQLRECTHDVPTGYRTIIIGLTDKEKEKIDKLEYKSFKDVVEYIESMYKGKIIEL